ACRPRPWRLCPPASTTRRWVSSAATNPTIQASDTNRNGPGAEEGQVLTTLLLSSRRRACRLRVRQDMRVRFVCRRFCPRGPIGWGHVGGMGGDFFRWGVDLTHRKAGRHRTGAFLGLAPGWDRSAGAERESVGGVDAGPFPSGFAPAGGVVG